jgi:hypothetical protein
MNEKIMDGSLKIYDDGPLKNDEKANDIIECERDSLL